MRDFTIHFPDRVVEGETVPGCSCMVVACDNRHVKRGVTIQIRANTKQDAWARMKERYPFERIEVT